MLGVPLSAGDNMLEGKRRQVRESFWRERLNILMCCDSGFGLSRVTEKPVTLFVIAVAGSPIITTTVVIQALGGLRVYLCWYTVGLYVQIKSTPC